MDSPQGSGSGIKIQSPTESLQTAETPRKMPNKTKLPITWQEIEKLEAELQKCQLNNMNLHLKLKEKVSRESGIKKEFVAVREEYETVKIQVEKKRKMLNDLEQKVLADNLRRDQETRNKLNQIHDTEKLKINELKNKIEKRKWEHEKILEELNQDSEVGQIASDLERDEVETSLRKELVDINMKIWREAKRNSDLQAIIDELNAKKQVLSQVQHQPSVQNQSSENLPMMRLFQLNNMDDIFEPSQNDWSYGEAANVQQKKNYGPLKLTTPGAYLQQKHYQEGIVNNFANKRVPSVQQINTCTEIREAVGVMNDQQKKHDGEELKLTRPGMNESSKHNEKLIKVSNSFENQVNSFDLAYEKHRGLRSSECANPFSGSHKIRKSTTPVKSSSDKISSAKKTEPKRPSEYPYQELPKNPTARNNNYEEKIEPKNIVCSGKSSKRCDTFSMPSSDFKPKLNATKRDRPAAVKFSENSNFDQKIKTSFSHDDQKKLQSKYANPTSEPQIASFSNEDQRKLQNLQSRYANPTSEPKEIKATFLNEDQRKLQALHSKYANPISKPKEIKKSFSNEDQRTLQSKYVNPTSEPQPSSFKMPQMRRPVAYTGNIRKKYKMVETINAKPPDKKPQESRYAPLVQTFEVKREKAKESDVPIKKSKKRKLFDRNDLSYLEQIDLDLNSSFELSGK